MMSSNSSSCFSPSFPISSLPSSSSSSSSPLQQWPLVVRFRFPTGNFHQCTERHKLKGYIKTSLHQCGIEKHCFLPDEKGSIIIVVGVNVRRESAIALNLQRPNAAQSLFGRYLETGKLRELPELICKWRRRKRRRKHS
mmetsp:Transcript_6735/g.9326  ORF Transcript_6735/g.9326 Transcript_6735/m.9326 type:complete len:139 (+) Transcript_6735:183-599(+)